MVEKKKRNNATITFSDRAQKEKLLLQLNSIQLQNLMPECARGKDCQKVIWAVDYLYNLAVKGKIRVQVPMFELYQLVHTRPVSLQYTNTCLHRLKNHQRHCLAP